MCATQTEVSRTHAAFYSVVLFVCFLLVWHEAEAEARQSDAISLYQVVDATTIFTLACEKNISFDDNNIHRIEYGVQRNANANRAVRV